MTARMMADEGVTGMTQPTAQPPDPEPTQDINLPRTLTVAPKAEPLAAARYSKAIVAVVGAGATAALGIFAPHSSGWNVATVTAAMCTAAGVYLVPNTPAPIPRTGKRMVN